VLRPHAMHDGLTAEDLRFTPPDLAENILRPFLRKHWGIEGDFKRLSGERDQNFRITTASDAQFVYKISSPVEDPLLVDFQIKALLHLEETDPDISVPRVVRSKSGKVSETLIDDAGEAHVVRVLNYVPGVRLCDFGAPSTETIERIGALQGRLCRAFSGFDHIAATHFMPWDIMNGLVISRSMRTDYLKNGLAKICAPALERLENDSLPRMHNLPHQVVHNDAHSGNVMCDPDDPSVITGIIDFGDLVKRPLVVDLSTALTSIIQDGQTPLQDSAALIRGFSQYLAVPDNQLELISDAILARAILSVQLLEFRVAKTNVGADVRDGDLPESRVGLEKVMAIDPTEFLDCISAAVPTIEANGD
jgi:hydroxylysine kinase